jgi:hypothetical protein
MLAFHGTLEAVMIREFQSNKPNLPNSTGSSLRSAKRFCQSSGTHRNWPSGYLVEVPKGPVRYRVTNNAVNLQSPYEALDVGVFMNVVLVTQLGE